ncbi:MAG: ABC transporter substrate-binding protein [Streptococcaceae bacterium]|jgi:raffinose/stachyose/melibiose transport system substrate-binding protein|nr:ABC transporter substrate-binding protein [Streptococcaceae bacterium]MCH4176362.1 ABC transporter substrate-binding protein [Streptococcaceae bacterium]
MKKWQKLGVALLAAATFASLTACGNAGSSKGSDDEFLYVFNGKGEIADSLKALVKEYGEEKGIKVKTYSMTVGAQNGTEIQTTEFNSNTPPTIFSSGTLNNWGPASGDYMLDISDSDNKELKKLADEVPEAQRLTADNGENFGLPYNIEGYGYQVDTELLKELIAGDSEAFLKDMKAETDYQAWANFVKAADAYIKSNTVSSFKINGNEYTFAASKGELTKQLNGVFCVSPSETWTYMNHWVSFPLNTVFQNQSDAFSATGDEGIKDAKSALKHEIEALDLEYSYTAGKDGATKRGADFIDNTTGNYDVSLSNFAEHKGIFLKQGNWIYPNLVEIDKDIVETMALVPVKWPVEDSDIKIEGRTADLINTTIPAFVPNYFIINKQASKAQQETAADFLVWLYTSERGKKFLKEEAGFIMYNDLEDTSSPNKLNNAVAEYVAAGPTLGNPFDGTPGSFNDTVGNILKSDYMTKETWSETDYDNYVDTVVKTWKQFKAESGQ